MTKRGLLLAGGSGSRLKSLTVNTNKQLLPLYNKPIIAYPLQTLKELGYVDILIIAGSEDQKNQYIKLLGDGAKFDLNLSYAVQDKPNGLAEAFIIGEDFCKDADKICMMLGDNIILGVDWSKKNTGSNTIYSYTVKNPEQYGVVISDNRWIVDIVEKPKDFISDDAVIGLYIFNKHCIEVAKNLKPSARGELEIVDLIKDMNRENGAILVEDINDGFWFDVGDVDSLLDCANLVRTIDKRSNHAIGIDL
jgi:glucose-1-phosphate thymidylyltransferase